MDSVHHLESEGGSALGNKASTESSLSLSLSQDRSQPPDVLKAAQEAGCAALYKPLDPERNEIRLLRVKQAWHKDAMLDGELSTVQLSKNTKFAALSYTWGDASDTKSMTINGIQRKITKNLAEALCEFRARRGEWHGHDDRDELDGQLDLIWVDAVCIDQSNVEERNHTVNMMYRIYHNATLVISWLHSSWPYTVAGENKLGTLSDIMTAFRFFEELYFQVDKIQTRENDMENLMGWTKKKWLRTGISSANILNQSTWDAVSSFNRHEYFSRLWLVMLLLAVNAKSFGNRATLNSSPILVMQEMAAAGYQVFWASENASLDGRLLKHFVEWERSVKQVGRIPDWVSEQLSGAIRRNRLSSRFMSAWLYFVYGDTYIKDARPDFCRAVMGGRQLNTTDPRDKVFALRVMPTSMAVDYNMTTKEVYVALHRQYMDDFVPLLGFLALCGTGTGRRNRHGLPSWIPDYSIDEEFWAERYARKLFFSANTGLVEFSVIQGNDILRARGCLVDNVTSIEPVLYWSATRYRNFLGRHLRSTEEAGTQPMYPTGISRFQAAARTLLFGTPWYRNGHLSKASPQQQGRIVAALQLLTRPDLIITHSSLNNPFSGIDAFNEFLQELLDHPTPPLSDKSIKKAFESMEAELKVRSFSGTVTDSVSRYRLGTFHTEQGYLGFGPTQIQVGDLLCVLGGSTMPVLLRNNGSFYEHVGTCFVLGYMEGEAGKLVAEGKLVEQEFSIR